MIKYLLAILLLAGSICANTVNLSGRIVPPFHEPIYVTLHNIYFGGDVTVRVNPFGYYTFPDVYNGDAYSITPFSKARIAFEPESYVIFQPEGDTDTLNFTYSVYGDCVFVPCWER